MEMYVIVMSMDKYIINGVLNAVIGYTETEEEAKKYCERKSEDGIYYKYIKVELIKL